MLIIDRFEGEYAVVETSNGIINIHRTEIPKTAKEGDALILQIDNDATDKQKEKIKNKMNRLFKD